MNQCDRIKLILQENGLKQKELAAILGVTDSYISLLVRKPESNISLSLASLMEEKLGYCTEWVLNGAEPKRKPTDGEKELSVSHRKALAQLKEMDENHAKAVLAFMSALDTFENL